jgi:hypothetical protein
LILSMKDCRASSAGAAVGVGVAGESCGMGQAFHELVQNYNHTAALGQDPCQDPVTNAKFQELSGCADT